MHKISTFHFLHFVSKLWTLANKYLCPSTPGNMVLCNYNLEVNTRSFEQSSKYNQKHTYHSEFECCCSRENTETTKVKTK